ncbi:MAG: site-2 protease family protein [Clostridiales Family XIII bacterium]|jgi:Zn-dependent protease|nr:site-2 protease family protein [Clostridiales Family XIII bacterium]
MKKITSGNFILVIFLVVMAYNAFTGGRFTSIGDWALRTALTLPGIVIGITIHEFAHAFAAYKLGDMTPKDQGRVTLNPLAHIDPVGIIALIFVGFGWGRPVQVNPYAFKKYRRFCNIITDVAGVITNFVVAFLVTGILMGLGTAGLLAYDGAAYTILLYIIMMNIVLMIFNLLPIPPLDGFGIITEIFDLRRFHWYQPFYQNGSLILLLLIVFDVISGLLTPALTAILNFMSSVWSAVLL